MYPYRVPTGRVPCQCVHLAVCPTPTRLPSFVVFFFRRPFFFWALPVLQAPSPGNRHSPCRLGCTSKPTDGLTLNIRSLPSWLSCGLSRPLSLQLPPHSTLLCEWPQPTRFPHHPCTLFCTLHLAHCAAPCDLQPCTLQMGLLPPLLPL